METLLIILLAIAMLTTLFALGGGLVSLWQGDDAHSKRSGKMMQLRVAAQAVAIILVMLIAALKAAD